MTPTLPLQGFPQFNIYSTPLLILVIQGLILVVLLSRRYMQKRALPDLLLVCVLLIMCYHRTTYTIGFMGWYDTFRNTKVNYYLVNMGLLMAPLIYFYVRSILEPQFKLQKKHLWHVLPWLLFFITKVFILVYDSQQPNFDEHQNGYLVENFQWPILDPIVQAFSLAQTMVYLAFSFQLYYRYKQNLNQFFSNVAEKELKWVQIFLLVYSFLFVYDVIQGVVDSLIVSLSWIQMWWIELLSAIALLYFGVKGYFTDFGFLEEFRKTNLPKSQKTHIEKEEPTSKSKVDSEKESLRILFEKDKIYLDPELNLAQLSEKLALPRSEVSLLINVGFGKNFNDFVNHFRIEQFKNRLQKGDHQQLSLLGLAFDCGFNSKATFNRVFKKEVQQTPSEYLQTLVL